MIWNPSEQHDLREVIARIEKYRGLRCAFLPKNTLRLKLSDAERLKADLAYQKGGALLVRHLFKELDFDEGRLFAFRFDHKLVQAHILQHYCPGVVPITVGVMRELCGLTFIAAEKKINDAYDHGFFIKAGLGENSGEMSTADRRSEIISILCNGPVTEDGCSPWEEQFIFQKKVAISEEYRVHSLENTIIPDLTYSRYSPGTTNQDAIKIPNLFVQNILNELPSGLIRDSLYGWDIAIDRQGNPIVIEVNSTGLHPVFRPGFQCSGFFLTPAYSISCLARLLEAVSQIYGVAIDILAPSYLEDQFASTYRLAGIYQSLLSAIASVRTLITPNQQFSIYPENVSNNLSFEENALLWALTEMRGVESKVLSIGHRKHSAGEKSTKPELMEEESGSIGEKPQVIPDENNPAQLFVHSNTHLHPLNFYDTIASAQPEVSPLEHKRFFQQMLGDMDEPTAPFGLLESEEDSALIEESQVELELFLVRRLQEAARRLDVDVETLFHLTFARVLVRVSGRTDVVFGTTLYGRLQGGTNPKLGLFSNILPLRIREENESVEAGVVRTRKLLADLKHHERASLSLAHHCSAIGTQTQMFAALLNYRRIPEGTDDTSRASEEIHSLYVEEDAIYPLALSVEDREKKILLTVRVRSPIGSIRFCDFIRTTLTSLVEALENAPTTSIRQIETLPSLERNRVLYEWNDTSTFFGSDECVHELFEAQARQVPDAVAVEYEGRALRYAELNVNANRLAYHLRSIGLKTNGRVAVCIERGLEMVVALMAVLKAGGAYVPLDSTYPAYRIKYMLENSTPTILLTQEHLHELFAGLTDDLVLLDIDVATLAGQDCPEANLDRESIGLNVENVAYVIYTSGSTGTPKGVQISHSSLANLIQSMKAELSVGIDDVFLGLTTISFDIAALELYLPLTLGARVKIVSRDVNINSSRLFDEIQNGTTIVQATPTTWQMLIEAGWRGKAGLKVICGGEALNVDLAGKLVSRCASVWNMYGPTETTIWSLIQKLNAVQGRVAIGRPIANTRIYILDEWGEPVPIGVAGELYIGGAGVACGYLNQAEQTRLHFLIDPFLNNQEGRMYRTGDFARYQPDGTVEFLGRKDSQVKIRGIRIELGEIEARLTELPGIRDGVVIVREGIPGDKRLVVYYTRKDTSEQDKIPMTAEMLRTQLSATLPDYMIPATYVCVESLPLTPSGKVDRKALTAPKEKESRTPEILLTTTESALLTLWKDVFNAQDVQRDDTFLSLGGHSFLAVRLINQLRSRFFVELPLNWLFSQNACIRELASLIDNVERG